MTTSIKTSTIVINQAKVKMVSDIIKNTNGDFFTATFRKAPKKGEILGEIRVMNCRTGVKKHLKGGIKTYDAKDSKDGDITIGVYEGAASSYKCLKASRVMSIKTGGNTIDFS